ncbi:MAG: IS91 family transposase [Rhodothermales bacterium]|nr:IS91 family transposase [Rhodothermales bacterium]
MEGHRPEVADVIRRCGSTFVRSHGASLCFEQRRALRDIAACRSQALGGHKLRCDRCGHEKVCYNSCRNRHCPKCQAGARAQWLESRQQELLDVPYFHVVFTLPEAVGRLALQNKREVYGILFRAAAETLQILGRDPKHLGAEVGFVAILHTWGQTLQHHPHLHCVVPGGGIRRQTRRWVASRPGFFLPVRVLSRLFRSRFVAHLQQARDQRQIRFHGQLTPLTDQHAWRQWLRPLRSTPWVVYSKPPFGGALQVLKYLARYTHRTAISNGRLVAFDGIHVSFTWKDYAHDNRARTMTLDATEFIRRFLLHVLPKGFVRVRYYGFLSNRDRKINLRLVRSLLEQAEPGGELHAEHPSLDPPNCPACRNGRLIVFDAIPPGRTLPWLLDTS